MKQEVSRRKRHRRGAALLEFALTAFTLYLLVAGGIELGRTIFVSQVLQDAARVAAREFSVTPLPANSSFEDALTHPLVLEQIWDEDRLVIDLDEVPDVEEYIASLPLVNQALIPLFIRDTAGEKRFLRYPGALLTKAGTEFGYTVGVPRVESRDENGVEAIRWVPVLEEVSSGHFSVSGPLPNGIAAVRINYPFQAAMLSGYRNAPAGVDENGVQNPNIGFPIAASDEEVVELNELPPGAEHTSGSETGPYSGVSGLGSQQALGVVVRPYRRLLMGQAIFRREVFE